MPSHRDIPLFPLLLAGISSPFENLLRAAGIPTVPLPRTTVPIGALPGRILLFDSRTSAGRAGAQQVARYGVKRIDVASLIIRHRRPFVSNRSAAADQLIQTSAWKELDLFRRLKAIIEHNGGTWMRIGDFPYPFQSAVCWSQGPVPDDWQVMAEVFAAAESGRDKQWLQRRYASRLPTFAIGPHAVKAVQTILQEGRGEACYFSLLWRASLEDFARWWHTRNRIRLAVRTHDSVHKVRTDGEFGDFRPILELWHGDRMAILPITAGTTTIDERGVPFVLEPSRYPGGCASVLAATYFSTQSAITIEQQSTSSSPYGIRRAM